MCVLSLSVAAVFNMLNLKQERKQVKHSVSTVRTLSSHHEPSVSAAETSSERETHAETERVAKTCQIRDVFRSRRHVNDAAESRRGIS